MSKFTKLVRNPRKFLVDSRLRRVARLATEQLRFPTPRQVPVEARAPTTAWRADLLHFIAAQVPVLLVPEQEAGTTVRVGVRRMDQQRLTRTLAELATTRLRLSLRGARNSRFSAHPRRLFALDSFLTKQKSFSVQFQETVNGETLKTKLSFEFWEDNDLHWSAPRRNPVARRVSAHTVEVEGLFQVGRPRDVRELTRFPLPTFNSLEIDVVYTWVNHQDREWRKLYADTVGNEAVAQEDDATSFDRFLSRDELRYSIRSIAQYAPWVRRIHIVSNCAPPAWLDLAHPKIRWVDHSQIFDAECLPTFSSHAIEARLQHVPDLAEHFLYFNDDFLLARKATPTDFFFSNGVSKSFTEEYGVVNGPGHEADPDYMNAARNGQRLIEQRFGRTPTALHKHTPYALRRSVLLEMERTFPEAYQRTVRGKFRSMSDISTVSFLYHHFAYLTGSSFYAARDAVLLKPAQAKYVDKMLEIVDGSLQPLSICVNDGQGSADDPNWDQHIRSFLEALFGETCEFELRPDLDRTSAASPDVSAALLPNDELQPQADHGRGEPSAGDSTASA
ncbi:MAG TPA: stealth conserved region 3 domain-containing protein [Polyangiaceae bacterium]